MNIFELIISLFVLIPNKEVNVVENVNLNYYNGSWYQYYTNIYSLFFNDISNCSKYNFNVLNDTNYLLEESYLDNQLITKLNSQGILENSILENVLDFNTDRVEQNDFPSKNDQKISPTLREKKMMTMNEST